MDTCRTIIGNPFTAENIRTCEEYVISIQRRLDRAVANNDKESIRETFDLLAKRSNAVKVLAIWKITQRNKGKFTAGVDGMSMPKGSKREQDQIRLELLKTLDIGQNPKPIRRVYIPKPSGKKQPLGIPTIQDRIIQEILRTAIEPIAEYYFNDNSYGFRPKRSCQDAMQHLWTKLAIPHGHRYVIEGDIKGCFDNINHDHIINTLEEWLIPKWATKSVRKMLESGIFHKGEVYDSETGTPQGGVISPLLANVALTTLDNFCEQELCSYKGFFKRETKVVRPYTTNPIVRYADEFVIVCDTELHAEMIKERVAQHIHKIVGLTLSEEKTQIAHIKKGFDFLGFTFRKYKPKGKQRTPVKKEKKPYERMGEFYLKDYTLLITPQKEKVINLLRTCQDILHEYKSGKQSEIIRLLNRKLVGWGMYYRHCASKDTFHKIDHELWWKLYRWSKRRHPQKESKWIYRKYFGKGKGITAFRDNEANIGMYTMRKIPIRRFVKVRKGMRVFDNNPETIEYWNKREYTNAYSQIYPVKMRRLYQKQNGKCSHCKGHMSVEEIHKSELHIHHMKPQSLKGTNDYSNLRLVHNECHRELHAKHTRKEMRDLVDKGIDYIQKSM